MAILPLQCSAARAGPLPVTSLGSSTALSELFSEQALALAAGKESLGPWPLRSHPPGEKTVPSPRL